MCGDINQVAELAIDKILTIHLVHLFILYIKFRRKSKLQLDTCS